MSSTRAPPDDGDQLLALDLDALALSLRDVPSDDLLDKALCAPLSRPNY